MSQNFDIDIVLILCQKREDFDYFSMIIFLD